MGAWIASENSDLWRLDFDYSLELGRLELYYCIAFATFGAIAGIGCIVSRFWNHVRQPSVNSIQPHSNNDLNTGPRQVGEKVYPLIKQR